MLRAWLWQHLEKRKPLNAQIAAVRKHFGSDFAKSRVLPAAVGVRGEWEMVEIANPDARNQIIRVKATPITALPNECPKQFSEINKTLMIVNGDLFKHLAPETMCPTWLFDYMTRANILICGSRTVIMNLYKFLRMENDRRENEDSEAPRIFRMLADVPLALALHPLRQQGGSNTNSTHSEDFSVPRPASKDMTSNKTGHD